MSVTLAEIQATGLPLDNFHDIAAAVSAGRTKLIAKEIGCGTVLETLGIIEGNTLLRTIKNTPDFEFVWPLLVSGQLRADSELVRSTLDYLASGGVIKMESAAAIKQLAEVADPVTWEECREVVEKGGI